jgi:hypothetical protein
MSTTQGGNAPSWLFSFVDLAFLLLIAMTQLAPPKDATPDLGELTVPRIAADATSGLPAAASERWQLRVHPPEADRQHPFELLRPANGEGSGERLDLGQLRGRLARIHDADPRRPLLAPHEDARSQDLLDAVALVEELWPGSRRTAVSPLRVGG